MRHALRTARPPRLHRALSILAAATALAALMVVFSPADAAHAACKPPGVPQLPGAGASGFLDPATEDPSGATMYGQYGWSGLKWYNCELGGPIAGNEWAGDPVAGIDTMIGNGAMGAATFLAALMTALHKWNADPSGLLEPIDSLIVGLSNLTREVVVNDWITVVMALGGITLLAAALTRQVRKVGYTFLATMGAFAFMATIGTYPLQIAQGIDGVASSMVTNADQRALEQAGITADPTEAMGAILNDRILWPLWARGQTNNPDQATPQPGTENNDFTNQFFKAATMGWSEVDSEDPERMRDRYNDVYEDVKDSSDHSSMIQTVKGQSYNRSSMGLVALAEVSLIAAIRIPAEALVLGGVILFRFIPILGPIFAILAILERTRTASTFGIKAVFASVYNVVLYGVIAAIHTALLSYMVANANLGFTLIVSILLTYVFFKLAAPFRSLTTPATGHAMARAGENVVDTLAHTPGERLGQLWRLANGGTSSPQDAPTPASDGYEQAPQNTPAAPSVYHHQQILVMAASDYVRPHPGPVPRPAHQGPTDAPAVAPAPQHPALPSGTDQASEHTTRSPEVRPERGAIVVHPSDPREVVPERGSVVVHPSDPREVQLDACSLRQDDRSQARATPQALAPLLNQQQSVEATPVPHSGTVNEGPEHHEHHEAVLFHPHQHIAQLTDSGLQRRYFIPPTMRPESGEQHADLFIPGEAKEG